MIKLVIQIPCYNEEKTLPLTVEEIPRQIPGVDCVEILVVDDGSTDNTVKAAEKAGVDHIVKHVHRKGLAHAFMTGLDASLRSGAHIIVNTDGDNQYRGEDIPKLIAPILDGKAEIVIGDRRTDGIEHFRASKKKLQKVGSMVVRLLSNTRVPDAVSGFRAYNRDAAMQVNILSSFSHTIETILQAGGKHLAVVSVPVGTNPKTRESRLFKHPIQFLEQSVATMLRTYTMYYPLRVFSLIGGLLILGGLVPSIRFLVFFLMGEGSGHVQSLILAAVLLVIGFQILVIGLLADMTSLNRKLIEEILLRIKKIELDTRNSDNRK